MTASGHERPMVPEYFPMKTNQKSQAELLSRTIWLPASGRTLPHFRHRKVNFGNGQKRVDHRYMDKYISDRKSKISASKLVLAQIDPVILTSCQKCIFYHQTASASIPPSLYYLVGWRPTKTRIEALLTRAPNAVACNLQHFNSLKVDMDQSKPSLAPLISYYWTAKVHNRGAGFKTPQKICTSGVQWTKSWYPVQFARVNGGPLWVSFIVSTLAAAAVIAKAPTATEEISLSTVGTHLNKFSLLWMTAAGHGHQSASGTCSASTNQKFPRRSALRHSMTCMTCQWRDSASLNLQKVTFCNGQNHTKISARTA